MAQGVDALFRPVGASAVQFCPGCNSEYSELIAQPVCERCGGLFEIRNPAPSDNAGSALTGEMLKQHFARDIGSRALGRGSGVWRYENMVMPGAGAAIVSHPEGNTPLLSREALIRYTSCDGLLIKHEGHNPTGSFKDRGMTVGVTQAVRIGASAVACASTGNTSASLAAYAAQAGIPGLVFVPAGQVALGKMMQTLSYGARTLVVRGDFDDCLRLVQAVATQLGVYLLNSINPYRLEGQKTIVFEMLQQLEWDAPDFIVLPAGNLGNTSAFGKALREAYALGLINKLPRLVAVQASGAAPFARSFSEGFATRYKVVAHTLATAIKIGDPASHDRARQAIEENHGLVLSATDDEILAAKVAIDATGVGCEPASAASIAGVRQLVEQGVILKTHRVVAVLTGHVLKDPGILTRIHQETEPPPAGANRPVEIDADVRAVERILNRPSTDN
ncbi:MAG: threonine synthase [Phycisphaerae bacterium]|nr:threonine synthase [Gemmatimonadaceae bacterium]